jgi:mono/diheme cytochrome c family protein
MFERNMPHRPLGRRVTLIVASMLCVLAPCGLGAQNGGPTYTAEQATRGQAAYQHSCQACHGAALDDGDFGGAPLRGSWFRQHWGSGDVATLFSYLKAAMPPDNPGSLTDKTYADLLAFILKGNDYPPGQAELPPDADAMQRMTLAR